MFPLRALILGSAALTLAGCATSPASDFWNLAPIVRNTDASIDGRSETVKRGDTLAVHVETDLKPTYRWELTRLAGASVVQIGLPDYQPEGAAGVPRGGAVRAESGGFCGSGGAPPVAGRPPARGV